MFDTNQLFEIAAKSSLLLAIAFILTATLRKLSPATLHRIWTLSFLGCFVGLALPERLI